MIATPEFRFLKGLAVAIFAGVTSSCFAFELAAGQPFKTIAIEHGAPRLWRAYAPDGMIRLKPGRICQIVRWAGATIELRRHPLGV